MEKVKDTIYRQDAINAIRASTQKYTGFMEMEMYTDDDAVEAIINLPSAQPKNMSVTLDVQKITKHKSDFSDLPSAQPERKTGEWITQEFGSWAECSECHELYDIPIAYSNFCPNCGADMRGGTG